MHEHPKNIFLSTTEINNGTSVNKIVGKLRAEDEDAKESFKFTLSTGQGDENNDLFMIV